MSSPLIFKALEVYSNSYQRLATIPLEYDPTTRKWVYISDHKKLFWFYINCLLLHIALVIYVYLIASYLLSNQSQTPLWMVIIQAACVILVVFGICVQMGILIFGEIVPSGMNNAMRLENRLRSRNPRPPPRKFDLLGLAMVQIAYTFALYPFFIVPFGVFLNLDPLGPLFNMTMSTKFLSRFYVQFILVLIRLFLCLVACMEICRYFPFLIILLIYAVRLGTGVIPLLALEKQPHYFMWMHNSYRNLHTLTATLVDLTCAGLLLFGLCTSVVFNFATLRMYSLIPMPLYLFFPSVSILIPIVMKYLIPPTIYLHEGSKENLLRRKEQFGLRADGKYLLRKLRAMKPWAIHAGLLDYRFCKMKASTKTTYYNSVLDFSINAMLSIKIEDLSWK